jgi:uncharacterized protein (DUF58 family)
VPRREGQAPLAGPYSSAFRGRGIEFDEVRAYHPGDDVRHIDWRVTARTGQVHSKVFQEEREQPVWVLLDVGPTLRFGTRRCFKSVAAAEAAALVAWAAHLAGDRVGGVVLAPDGITCLTPRSGEGHLFSLLSTLAAGTARPADDLEHTPRLRDALSALRQRTRPGSRVFVISDFDGLDEEAAALLVELQRRSDVSCVLVSDPLERTAPPPGRYRVSDGERVHAFSSQGVRWREAYESHFTDHRDRLAALCRPHTISLAELSTDDDPAAAIGLLLRPGQPTPANRRAA